MNNLHKKSNTFASKEPTPSGKPTKPKKPAPTQETSVKIPVPCSVLNEERVREIAREEIKRYMGDRALISFALNKLDKGLKIEKIEESKWVK
jgi:hypothetical protein